MEQIWLALCIAAGVVFGFLTAWLSMRSDRAAIYARGKSDGENERAAVDERLVAKDRLIQEILDERNRERESIERLKEEHSALKSAQLETDDRVSEVRREGYGRIKELTDQIAIASSALDLSGQEAEGLRQECLSLRATVQDLTTQLETVRAESGDNQTAAEEAEALREDCWSLRDTIRQLTAELETAQAQSGANQATAQAAIDHLHEQQERIAVLSEEVEKKRQEMAQTRIPAEATPAAPTPALEELIRPLHATLEGLSRQVSRLAEGQQDLQAETAQIAGAFRVSSSQGVWNEVQLRRVVELAGLTEHCGFDWEADRPGITIYLPGNRRISVDASLKVEECLEALQTSDTAARAQKLREHAGRVRAHVDRLALNGHGAEFAVAFLPADSILGATLEQDPGLIEYGAERKVLLATPTTLIGLLKAVSYGWQQQNLVDNARQVSDLGQAVYEHLREFAGYFKQLRRSLARAVDTYNLAASSLETRVLGSAREFEDLGCVIGDPVPEAEQIDTVPRSLFALDAAVAQSRQPSLEEQGDPPLYTGPHPAGVSMDTL